MVRRRTHCTLAALLTEYEYQIRSCRLPSHVNSLRYFQRIIYLNPQVSDRAVEIRVPEEKLYGPKIFGAPVDKGCFRSS